MRIHTYIQAILACVFMCTCLAVYSNSSSSTSIIKILINYDPDALMKVKSKSNTLMDAIEKSEFSAPESKPDDQLTKKSNLDKNFLENHPESKTSFPKNQFKKSLKNELLDAKNKAKTPQYSPISYGYSETETRKLFSFPSKINCTNFEALKYKQGHYQVSCPSHYSTGIEYSRAYPEVLGSYSVDFNFSTFTNNMLLDPNSEYHLVKCDDLNSDIIIRNVKNQSLVESLKEKTKIIEKRYGSPMRPTTVIILMIDCASRQLIYRNLKKTIQLFNDQIENDSNYVFHDFLLNNAIRPFTYPNLIAMLYGLKPQNFYSYFTDKKEDEVNELKLWLQNNRSVFEYFREMGFVTLISSDDENGELSNVFGKQVQADHRVFNFWKLLKTTFEQQDSSKNKSYCSGRRKKIEYSLDYLNQFIKNYEKMNKFAFLHTFIAHEDTGTRLSLADEDFLNFFKHLFETFDHKNEDLVFMLAGDHGISQGDFTSIESLAERVMASHFIISNKELEIRLNSHEVLKKNTKRLVSRYDWYKTISSLSFIPYISTFSDLDPSRIQTDFPSVNVFSDIIDIEKNCEKSGVDFDFCLSRGLVEDNDSARQQETINFILDSAQKKIKQFKDESGCRNDLFYEILKVQKFAFYEKDSDLSANYYIQVKSSSGELLILHGSQGAQNKYRDWLPKNRFSDVVRNFHRSAENENLHILQELESITKIGPLLRKSDLTESCEEGFRYDNNLYLNDERKSCEEFCEDMGMECNRPGIYSVILEYLERIFGNSEVLGEFDSIEVVYGMLVVGKGDCCLSRPSHLGVCYCSLR